MTEDIVASAPTREPTTASPGLKKEFELKFRIRPEHMTRLQRARWVKALGGGRSKVKTLNATYFDTPDMKLRRDGLYLRVRREGRRYMQCVKGRDIGSSAAFARREWEIQVAANAPDTAEVLAGTAPIALPLTASDALEPVFETRVRRTHRTLAPAEGSAVSLDLDVGEIVSGGKAEPVCEAELELIEGDPRHLFDVALKMLDEVPVRLVSGAKADRGYALYAGDRAKWRKADPLVLPADGTAEEALVLMVLNCLDHLRANEACVVARDHEEGVHQMRVATRRLRSGLAMYKSLLPAEQHDGLIADLRWLIGALGPARDLDVFRAEVLEPVMAGEADERDLEPLRREIEAERDRAYAAAQEAIGSKRYTELLLRFGAWVEGRRWRPLASAEALAVLDAPAGNLAGVLLEKRFRKVRKAGKTFETLTADERHALRIQIKKLRYAAEFLGSLFGRKKVARFVDTLKALQDGLGMMNDLAVARRLMADVADRARGDKARRLSFAAGIVVGWHTHVIESREREVAAAWERFAARPRFWPAR